VSSPVRLALERGAPVVALESTVIAHGLPWPDNLALAHRMEAVVAAAGATPATIALLEGRVHVGLSGDGLERIAGARSVAKISRRDLAFALARGQDGATTVAATMLLAHRAGIQVMATGGIGGVHRGSGHDISADLPELARTPMVVVCSGAKAILDLPATLEWLETHGVPVLGFGTDELPAFYSRSSGLPLRSRVDSPSDVAAVVRAARALALDSAVLVTVPCPIDAAVPDDRVEAAIARAVDDADREGIRGARLTPYLLARVADLTGGATREANLALLVRNAEVAAGIAVALGSRSA
jgi:pseudouridine-5'-phosphate glycosidase